MRRTKLLHVATALAAVAALAGAPAASAIESPPSPGSSQLCVAVPGGSLLQIGGYGTSFPANTTGTTTFTFANGDVVTLTATSDAEGTFHTATFNLDLRDPQLAALSGTSVVEVATFGSAQGTLVFTLDACAPSAPAGAAECKDNGFVNYPALGFKNQGDCVSWVSTHGTNEPGKNLP